LGERLVCNQEAIGSIPFTSTNGSKGSKDHRSRSFGFSHKGARPARRSGFFDNRSCECVRNIFHALSSGQANKGARWMPWRQEAMKDVAGCDKLR
jgi:hypothetical protein